MNERTLNFQSKTEDVVRIAVFKGEFSKLDQAWSIVEPPPLGEATLSVPVTNTLQARMGDEISNQMLINDRTASLKVEPCPNALATDKQNGLCLDPDNTPQQGIITVKISATLPSAVTLSLQKNLKTLIPEPTVAPGQTYTVQLVPDLYFVALVNSGEITPPLLAMKVGQTATIRGDKQHGYHIVV